MVESTLDHSYTGPKAVRAAITARTRAIMPVHFAGLPVDMEELYGLAAEHGLRVVEDAAPLLR